MATAPKTPVTKKPVATAAPKPKPATAAKPATPAKPATKPAASRPASPVKKAAAPTAVKPTAVAKKITPSTPESKTPASTGRKRLSKAFARPLDKKPAKIKLVRDRFTIPANEYEQLVQMKKRLVAQGVAIKKSDLVRAGLVLLAALDDAKLKTATAQLSVAKTSD
jgi:hypothetical protein